jgi:hypothetical protein
MTFELSNAPGGLLSCREIRRRCDEEELMLDWDDEMLRPAGYNVRIAKDGLVTPKGDIYKPLALGGEDTYNGVLWLARVTKPSSPRSSGSTCRRTSQGTSRFARSSARRACSSSRGYS